MIEEQEPKKEWITRMTPEERLHYKSKLDINFLEFINLIRSRLRNDWDIVIAVTGRCGTGKSNLTKWMGFLIDDEFDLVKNVAYLPYPEEIKSKFNELGRYQMFDVDECSKGVHKHGWQNKLQQEIAQMYDTERFQNKCTTMIMPRFKNFAENFRNYRVDIWINVIYRSKKKGKGVAVAYMMDADKDIEDPWHMKENIKLKFKRFKNSRIIERTTNKILDVERRTKNYLFDFEFPPLPKNIESSYKHFKRLSRLESENLKPQDRTSKRNNEMKRVKKFKEEHPEIMNTEIAKLFNVTPKTICVWLKEHVIE